jgi:hypothetical protein
MTEGQWTVREIPADEEVPEPEICPPADESGVDVEEADDDAEAE